MAWVYLFIAGGLEVFWSTFLKLSEGFTKLWPSVWAVVGMVASFFFLSQATKTLPMGTAYGIWTGIGALGAVIVGILAFQEPVTVPRLIFVGLLLVGIVGLKLTAQQQKRPLSRSFLCVYAFGRLQRNTAAQSRSTTVSAQPVSSARFSPALHSSIHAAAPARDAQA